ncbi:MAG: phosphate signaling complex protein PhoU [Trueperaceae bacterium]|jgi:phosphate transport system protein|nr:phosphate signaling complex protein PhoU [Truepera sp.]HRN19010.1 phosphate signaling complex protein PhoU [Trueperaceae bacterium]HRQ10262.1 phosphate signaling complex protein PhoU [Trueperaceae bacterium]
MTDSTATPLELDLQAITGDLVRMLSLVRESCEWARRALIEAEPGAAAHCAKLDAEIDAIQASLEMRILTVIARRQPAARDLRFLGAALQALADIERAGDYAEHVASVGERLAQQPPIKKYLDMQRIFEVLFVMIDTTTKAFAEGDAAAARRAHALDSEIDDLYDQIQRELLTYMLADTSTIGRASDLAAVARYLERLGDHLENVNEHIIFWLEAVRL